MYSLFYEIFYDTGPAHSETLPYPTTHVRKLPEISGESSFLPTSLRQHKSMIFADLLPQFGYHLKFKRLQKFDHLKGGTVLCKGGTM